MNPDTDDAFVIWQRRCQAQGLGLTASRSAILRALLEQSEAHDAVPLLQAAQMHHPRTSIGTVYRFLRELEQRGLAEGYAQAHGRTRWQLCDTRLTAAAQAANDIRRAVARVQDLLHTLEQTGLAEAAVSEAFPAPPSPAGDRTLAVLKEMAHQLGYRLLPDRTPIH
jgi:Fe2+ or Zn2+ uptake regulation protein